MTDTVTQIWTGTAIGVSLFILVCIMLYITRDKDR